LRVQASPGGADTPGKPLSTSWGASTGSAAPRTGSSWARAPRRNALRASADLSTTSPTRG